MRSTKLNGHSRILRCKLLEHAEDGGLAGVGDADGKCPGLPVRNGPRPSCSAVERVEHSRDFVMIRASGLRETDAFRAADKQCESQFLLERMDLLADGRLRNVAFFGRFREAQVARDRFEVLKLVYPHGPAASPLSRPGLLDFRI